MSYFASAAASSRSALVRGSCPASRAVAAQAAIDALTMKSQAMVKLQDFSVRLAREYIELLPIDMSAALLAGSMVHVHRDPFDRMIAGQATIEKMAVISSDGIFDTLVGRRIW